MLSKEQIKDKVRGNFLGVAIGDSLGKPVETLDSESIVRQFGRIENYISNSSHKWFSDDQTGTTTDDWQLTKAVARAMITTGKFDLDEIALEHVKEFSISVRGWGGSTRESVAKLSQGVHWKESSQTDKPNRGTGNGVCMKVSPVGLYMALTNPNCDNPPWADHVAGIANLAIMTHRTSLAVTSGLSHAFATLKCFTSTPKTFDKKAFHQMLLNVSQMGRQFSPETIVDDLQTRFKLLDKNFTPKEIIRDFGGGSCYVYDSLPFTYAFFLRNHNSIESLYDCVTAGGDTDSNGSMLAGLLGALHGVKIFPDHLIDGLKEKDEILEVADAFYERFVNAH